LNNSERQRNRRPIKWLWIGLIIGIVVLATAIIPLPYYVYLPGTAEQLKPIITVSGGHKQERGTFMLTTVFVLPASNLWYFLYGWAQPYSQVLPKTDVQGPYSSQEYSILNTYMMKSSKESSEVAALRYLGKPVQVKQDGLLVQKVMSTSKAQGLIQLGDLITAVDGHDIRTSDALISYLRMKSASDVIALTITRHGRTMTVKVPLIQMPKSDQSYAKAGIGIEQVPLQTVETPYQVQIKTGQIGGPSAGFMFSLEIVNQLSGVDLTKGYKIAGTGTMDMNGNIGQIGGIIHKIVAADRAGAQYFLAPAGVNARDAEQQARKIGTKMKVVPVKTLAEAVGFLKSLPEAPGTAHG